jgi:DNA-binding response OmpR family regulator
MTLLNIEDDGATQDAFIKRIGQISQGHVTIYRADSLAEGLALDREKKPAITLLDLLLPDSPTWQETVNHIPDFQSPVIVVTMLDVNENNYEIFMACMKAGARRVFQKPQMLKIWEWLSERPQESFAARLLGAAGTIHLGKIYGPTSGQ